MRCWPSSGRWASWPAISAAEPAGGAVLGYLALVGVLLAALTLLAMHDSHGFDSMPWAMLTLLAVAALLMAFRRPPKDD